MRRALLCVGILLFIAAPSLFSDAVMIHLYAEVSPEYQDRRDVRRIMSAVEDGVMSELFDAGHIVFNTVDRGTRMAAAQAAEAGRELGAEWVVAVNLEITRESGRFLLDRLDYRILDVEGEEVYLENEVDEETFTRRSDETREQASRRAGTDIGARLAEYF